MPDQINIVLEARWPIRSLGRQGVIYWIAWLLARLPGSAYDRFLEWVAQHGTRLHCR